MSSSWTESEDNFQGCLIANNRRIFLPKIYPKVERIAGETISPEIDALGIDITRSRIVGYEFKLLNSEALGTNYGRIHRGIGQAISYFYYGVDFAYLILGIPNTPLRDQLLKKIKLTRKLVRLLANNNFDRFQIWTYDGNRFSHPTPQTTNRVFKNGYYIDKLSRDNILAGRFAKIKAKNFRKKYNIPQW